MPPGDFTNETTLNCTADSSDLVKGFNVETFHYYAMVCDEDGNCSAIRHNSVDILSTPNPDADNVTITPADPNVTSTLSCNYDYISNGYPENINSTEYKWFVYNLSLIHI